MIRAKAFPHPADGLSSGTSSRGRFRRWLAVLTAVLFPLPLAAAEPEIRGFWIEAWNNGIKTPAQVDQVIADVRAGNFNAIIPQVRRRGDAFYQSNIEPRTADPAVPPGYDPLADLIAKARAAHPPIEVHAWIVVYPIWRVGQSRHPDPGHIYNSRPDWLTVSNTGETHDGTNYQVDPGHPEAQRHTFEVAMDLLTNYDIDGLHYDYIRYSGRTWGYNPVAVERFNRLHGRTGIPAPNDQAWLQFRRDQITQLVRKIYLSAMEVKPQLKISAATITWAPGPANLDQWLGNTSAYQHVLQDWRGWMEEGILDLNIPMAYFREHTHPEDWMKWIDFAKDHRYNRHVAIGPGIWLNSIQNTIKQMRDTRAPSPSGHFAQGVFCYSYQGTNNEGLPRSTLLHALTSPSAHDPITPPMFAQPAPIPPMPWKTHPVTGHLKGFVHDVITGEPVDGALVRLDGETRRTILTDATGFYGFVDLPPGDYLVTADQDGFDGPIPPESITVSVGAVAHADLLFGETVPLILSHPSSQTAMEGSRVVLSVVAGGMPELTYWWEFNGEEIDGADGPSLVLDPVRLEDAGEYQVFVSNQWGLAESEIAILVVEPAPPAPRFVHVEVDAAGAFAGTFSGASARWFLVEASGDFLSWLPMTTRPMAGATASFSDRDWSRHERRFYRAREVEVFLLADFEAYADGEAVLFRQPSFSGSTSGHIATGGDLPNFSGITGGVPPGLDRSRVLGVSWSFRADTDNPWLRLTTFNAPNIPNPTVDFSHGLRFKVHVDRPVHLAIGLRETNSPAVLGGNGGTGGSIEWVGGVTDNESRPPKGIPIPAGEWTLVHFFIPHEPVQGHTGNGILESATGKGVLENLTVVPADGPGIYHLHLDRIHAVELSP